MSSQVVESLDTEAEGGGVECSVVGREYYKHGKDKDNSYILCDCKADRSLVELVSEVPLWQVLEIQLVVGKTDLRESRGCKRWF